MDPALQDAAALLSRRQFAAGHAALEAVLAQRPQDRSALSLRAQAYLDEGRASEAEAAFSALCAQTDALPTVRYGWAESLRILGRFPEALEAYAAVLEQQPDHLGSLHRIHEMLGSSTRVSLRVEAALQGAVTAYRQAVARQPENAALAVSLGRVMELAGQFDEALAWYEQALQKFPDDYRLHNNLGCLLRKVGRPEEAVEQLQLAVVLEPALPDLLNNLGDALRMARRPTEAQAALEKAVALEPDFLPGWTNLATVCFDLKAYDRAIHCCREILRRDPNNARASNLIGNIESLLGHPAAAVQAYLRCIQVQPQNPLYQSNLLLSLNYDPSLSPETIFEAHQRFDAVFGGHAAPAESFPNSLEPQRRLRIGYVSPDFRWHSVAYFLEPVLHAHDREQVEVFCYALNSERDEMTGLLESRADHWRLLAGLNLDQAEALIRADAIDILVDLAGHTGNNALTLFARRVAPLQVSWLGYPNTTGLRSMNYRLTDARVDPLGASDRLSSERLVRLPEGFHVFRLPGTLPEPGPLPAQRQGFITFGCFNNSAKISPQVLESWAAILRALPTARLVIKNGACGLQEMRESLYEAFQAQGIERQRLDLLPATPTIGAHLECYQRVDLALDTFPYNGTTTTLEAMLMGVPTVTLRGDRHASRVGASLLAQVGLENWVADTPEAYVQKALAFAADTASLARLRQVLRKYLQQSPLTDFRTFARKLENAYRRFWIDHCERRTPVEATVRESLHQREQAIEARALARQGLLAQRRRHLQEAAGLFRQSLAIDPSQGLVWKLLAEALDEAQQKADAAEAYARATIAFPQEARLRADYGCCLLSLGRAEAAAEQLRQAVAIDGQLPGVWLNLGAALHQAGAIAEAAQSYYRALELLPTFGEAWNNLGRTLLDSGQIRQARAAFARALELKPELLEAHNNALRANLFDPELTAAQLDALHAGFPLAQVSLAEPARPRVRAPRDRLRVAYLSPDLRPHAVASFLNGVLEAHDRERFAITVYADHLGRAGLEDHFRSRVERWRQTGSLGHQALAEQIRADGIDLLVEMSGHMAYNRLPMLALRPAPVQLSWIGYPHPLHQPFIDYTLSDATIHSAPGAAVWNLPLGAHLFAPVDAPPGSDELPPACARGHVTFGSFHGLPKLNDRLLGLWKQVLEAVPGSHLHFKARQLADPSVTRVLQVRLQDLGYDLARCSFAPWTAAWSQRWEAWAGIDIALDAFPYNGMTTTCEALWMGVPVLTLCGQTPAARVAASMLTQCGWTDGIAPTPEAYIERARLLASDLPALVKTRSRLQKMLKQSPLGNPALFTEALEAEYLRIWERVCAADSPVVVPAFATTNAPTED